MIIQMVQDKKTGIWYDPTHEMMKIFKSKKFQAMMKRLKNR